MCSSDLAVPSHGTSVQYRYLPRGKAAKRHPAPADSPHTLAKDSMCGHSAPRRCGHNRRAGRKALLGSGAGGGIGLFGFRSRLAHIASKGLCFVLEGVLHRVADGVVGQQHIKGAYRPLTCHGSNASGKHGDQQNRGKPCRDLAAQGYTALRGFVPCHTLSLLSLQHPAFFISIIISRGKCNCKKHRFPQRNRCLQAMCQAVSGSTTENDSASSQKTPKYKKLSRKRKAAQNLSISSCLLCRWWGSPAH